jgi:uncharacterized membrane protein
MIFKYIKGDKAMESIFSTQKVNCGRQLELDLARGLAIVFMVLTI